MNITPGYFITLEQDRTLAIALHVHFGLSTVLNCVAYYCLLRKTPDYMLSVRKYLLLIQTATMLIDLVDDILVRIVLLTPAMAFYCTGVLCTDGIPINVPLALFVTFGGLVASSIALCFFFKHQTIVEESSRLKLSKSANKVVHTATFISCSIVFIFFLIVPITKDSSDQAIETVTLLQYPYHLQWILERGSYLVVEKTQFNREATVVTLVVITFSLLYNNIIVWHMYYTLNRMRTKRSAATRKMIKRSVIALHIQLIIPSTFLVAPVIIVGFVIATDTGTIDVGLVTSYILLLHSPLHSVILLAITPAYRRFLLSFCQRRSDKRATVSINSIAATRQLPKS